MNNNIMTYWSMNWILIAFLVLLGLFYLGIWKFKIAKRFIPFLFSIILIVICFFSPLQLLSEHYLFSAHMTVHVILLLLIAPLLVIALPPDSFNSFFSFLKKHPFVCWITGVGIMWFWHVPMIFNSMMNSMNNGNGLLFFIEPLSLLIAGIIFSAPIIQPDPKKRLCALDAVVYLFTACIGCSILGVLISFSNEGTYQHFLSMHDVRGINKMITGQWGMTRKIDQQIAGLIMWVPCCFIYLSASMYLLIEWLQGKNILSTEINQ